MEDRSMEDRLTVIEFEEEDDQNKRRSSKIIDLANGETSYRVKMLFLVYWRNKRR